MIKDSKTKSQSKSYTKSQKFLYSVQKYKSTTLLIKL